MCLLWSAESKEERGGSAFPLTILCVQLFYAHQANVPPMDCGDEAGTGRLRFSFNHPLRPIVLPPAKPNVPPMECGVERGTGRLRFSFDHPCVRLVYAHQTNVSPMAGGHELGTGRLRFSF